MEPERKAFTSPVFGANDTDSTAGTGFSGEGGGLDGPATEAQEKTQPAEGSPEPE
jgi:hypothetical protein